MTSLQLVRLIAKAAADKKARGVIRLDVRQRTSLADYFVICEGDTDRQVRAITDSILRAGRDQGARPFHMAGYEEGSWVVLDYAWRADAHLGYGIPLGQNLRAGEVTRATTPTGTRVLIGAQHYEGEILRFTIGFDVESRTFDDCRGLHEKSTLCQAKSFRVFL